MDIGHRAPLGELEEHIGEEVVITGFAAAIRKQKAVQFIILRDGMDSVQVTHPVRNDAQIAESINALTPESVIAVKGRVVADDRIKLRGIEVVVEELEVLSPAQDIPISPDSGLDVRLDWRFVDLRSAKGQLTMRVQTLVEATFREYCINQGMVEINSPKLMASPSESRSELFRVDYFDRSAYLAQSPQFFKQMGVAAGLPGVFETGPVFRANPSYTSRHDTEFTSLDVEVPWVTSHHDVMDFEEGLLNKILRVVADRFGTRIQEQFGVEVKIPQKPFARIPHAEALAIIREQGYEIQRTDGDLDPEAERILGRVMAETTGSEFVFVTEYPSTLRPFYHMRVADDPNLTKSYDLLWKGLEITTGAQREHRPSVLEKQILEKGHTLQELEHYTNFFKYGCPPHGGFGLGLTRLLMVMLGVANVREVTYLYRGPNRLTP